MALAAHPRVDVFVLFIMSARGVCVCVCVSALLELGECGYSLCYCTTLNRLCEALNENAMPIKEWAICGDGCGHLWVWGSALRR